MIKKRTHKENRKSANEYLTQTIVVMNLMYLVSSCIMSKESETINHDITNKRLVVKKEAKYMKLLFLTNIPSPYRVDFFNELGRHCELTVLFEREGYATRDKSWLQYKFNSFCGIILRGVNLGRYQKFCYSIFRYLRKNIYDYIVVCNMSTITGILAVYWMKIFRIPYCIEGDGGFAGSGKGLKERLKTKMISTAQLCFSTSSLHDEYYLKYGAKQDKIYRYPFTSLREKDILDRPLSKNKKEVKKQGLCIAEPHMILSVGSFIPRKGMDILIQAAARIDRKWGIYIVGGQPTEEYVALKEKYSMFNLHFVNFVDPEQLKKYYEAADLFVLATREDIWGLVVSEALSFALPVITTRKCVAGMELIRDGYNGLLVEVDNVADLQRGLEEFVNSQELVDYCAKGALETIREYTIEKMVSRHLRIFDENWK